MENGGVDKFARYGVNVACAAEQGIDGGWCEWNVEQSCTSNFTAGIVSGTTLA